MELDPVRLLLLKRLKRKKKDLKNASLAVGRNNAYLHQFVYRGSPKALPDDVRQALAKLLGVGEDKLHHSEVAPRKPRSDFASGEMRWHQKDIDRGSALLKFARSTFEAVPAH